MQTKRARIEKRTKMNIKATIFSLTFLFGQILSCKRNVRLKNVASGCDQCAWSVGVVAGHGHWVGH